MIRAPPRFARSTAGRPRPGRIGLWNVECGTKGEIVISGVSFCGLVIRHLCTAGRFLGIGVSGLDCLLDMALQGSMHLFCMGLNMFVYNTSPERGTSFH